MNRRSIGLWPLLLGLLGATTTHAQSIHKNELVGYRIRLPEDYSVGDADGWYAALPRHSVYLVDHFARKLPQATKDSWIDYDLFMATYYFPAPDAAPASDSAAPVETDPTAVIKKAAETIAKGDRNYRDFRSFAEDNITGFYFSKEKAAKYAGFPAVLYELKFDKLTEIKQLWVACAFKVPGGEFAVLFNCTEQHHKKYLPAFMDSFSSFTTLNKDGMLHPAEPKNDRVKVISGPTSGPAPSDLSPEELREHAVEQREAYFRAEIDKLPKGWRNQRSDHFVVLTHEDAAYTKEVIQQAEGVRQWLDEQFGGISTDAVGTALLRLFKDAADAGEDPNVIIFISSLGLNPDIRFWRQTYRSGSWTEFSQLNRMVLEFWFREKNSELWGRLPNWFSWSLRELVEDAMVENGKVTFKPDKWERIDLAQALSRQENWEKKNQEGSPPLLSVEEIFRLTTEEQAKASAGGYVNAQTANVMRFLLEGPGRKNDRTKDLLVTYLKHLLVRVEEVKRRLDAEQAAKKAEAGVDSKSLSEDEQLKKEDEEYRKRREETWESREKEVQEAAYEATFSGWTEQDWKDFDQKWRNWAPLSLKN